MTANVHSDSRRTDAMDLVDGVRQCSVPPRSPGTAHYRSHKSQQSRQSGYRDSRLRYSSSSSDGDQDVDRQRASRYTVDQQPSSGGGNDSGIGIVRPRHNGQPNEIIGIFFYS